MKINNKNHVPNTEGDLDAQNNIDVLKKETEKVNKKVLDLLFKHGLWGIEKNKLSSAYKKSDLSFWEILKNSEEYITSKSQSNKNLLEDIDKELWNIWDIQIGQYFIFHWIITHEELNNALMYSKRDKIHIWAALLRLQSIEIWDLLKAFRLFKMKNLKEYCLLSDLLTYEDIGKIEAMEKKKQTKKGNKITISYLHNVKKIDNTKILTILRDLGLLKILSYFILNKIITPAQADEVLKEKNQLDKALEERIQELSNASHWKNTFIKPKTINVWQLLFEKWYINMEQLLAWLDFMKVNRNFKENLSSRSKLFQSQDL